MTNTDTDTEIRTGGGSDADDAYGSIFMLALQNRSIEIYYWGQYTFTRHYMLYGSPTHTTAHGNARAHWC